MSPYPLDRLALVAGLPLLVIGLVGLLDDTAVVDIGSGWVAVALPLAVGGLGIALSFANLLRDRPGSTDFEEQEGPVDPEDREFPVP